MKQRIRAPYGDDAAAGLTARAARLTADGFVRAGIVRTLGPFLARYPNVPIAQLMGAAGIGVAQLADPDALLSLPSCILLLESAARSTGDAALGIGFAAQLPWHDLGVLGYVLLHSPTVGAALGNACRYFAVQQTAGGPSLEIDGGTAHLTYDVDDVALGPHAQCSELVLALFVRMVRESIANDAWSPRAIHFKHRAPKQRSTHDRWFHVPVLFEQPCDRMIVAAEDLRLPIQTADPNLLPILLRQAHASLPIAADFVGEIRRLVMSTLASGDVTIDRIAARLGTSARSIQRRLREVGSSFTAVVDETRHAMSRRYLQDPMLSLTETSFLLGYSELSAFSRAFRRWTGTSAMEYRRARINDRGACS